MKTLKKLLLLSLIGMSLVYCSKPEDGKEGPQGPPGNANVISSDWITATTISRDTTIDGTCVRVRHLTVPQLTNEILNKGQMITYMRVGSIGPYQLPYISDAGGATNMINCIYRTNKIFVYRHTFNTCRFNSGIPEAYPGQPVLVNLPQSLEYRYVFIPPAPAGSRVHNINLKEMTYDEVCDYFKLKK